MKKHRNADESIYDRPVWIVKYKEVSNLLENTAKGRKGIGVRFHTSCQYHNLLKMLYLKLIS